jgi:hypothetical protein
LHHSNACVIDQDTLLPMRDWRWSLSAILEWIPQSSQC